jgi:hypothetical protein
MREMTMFCSARDQDVRIIVTVVAVHDGQAPVLDPEMICLEIGEGCTGSLCPVCSIPVEAMDARLAKSGLRPDNHRSVQGHCDACDRETELVISCGGFLSCTECGSTRRWRVANLD